jgi:hypothetical protein
MGGVPSFSASIRQKGLVRAGGGRRVANHCAAIVPAGPAGEGGPRCPIGAPVAGRGAPGEVPRRPSAEERQTAEAIRGRKAGTAASREGLPETVGADVMSTTDAPAV